VLVARRAQLQARQQRRHVIGLELDRLVEVGKRQVGLPVAEIRPAALVVIARLARGIAMRVSGR